MTHQSSHVIVRFATPIEVARVKTRAGVAGLALILIGFALGAILL